MSKDVNGKAPLRAVIYARVSRGEAGGQDSESQLGTLRSWAASRGWQVVGEERDTITGDPQRRGAGDPPGLRAAFRRLEAREADVLAVFSADRLVRSPMALLQLVGRVQALGAHVVSRQDGADLDTTTDSGELLVFLKGWFGRMQLRLLRAATIAGLDRARAAGKKLGQPRKPVDAQAAASFRAEGLSWSQVAKRLGCTMTTARRRAAEGGALASTAP